MHNSCHYCVDGEATWDERNWLQRREDFPFKPLTQAEATGEEEERR